MRDDGAPTLGSVDNALRIILMLRARETLSVSGVAAELGVATSTAHRLLAALTSRGFATQNPDRRYRLGPAIEDDVRPSVSLRDIRLSAGDALAELGAAVRETVHLMVLRGQFIRFVDGIEGSSTLRVGVRVGEQMPAYCSAGGKALLAELSPSDIDRLFRDGLPEWPTSRIETIKQLRATLARVRRAGFGLNVEETEAGVVGIGVCVRAPGGSPAAAVTLAIPVARFERADLAVHVDRLRRASVEIEQRLASSGHAPGPSPGAPVG